MTTYKLKQLGDFIQIVCYDRHGTLSPSFDKKEKDFDGKLTASISRAKRTILEKILCNPFTHFITITFDETKQNRYDEKTLHKRVTRWFRENGIKFLIVPEQHKDGAYHYHGVIFSLANVTLSSFIRGVHPIDLCDKGYFRIIELEDKFGFCSVKPIEDKFACALYITKYVTKEYGALEKEKGSPLYYCSRGLAKAISLGELYGVDYTLGSLLTDVGFNCAKGWLPDDVEIKQYINVRFRSEYGTNLFEDFSLEKTVDFDDAYIYVDMNVLEFQNVSFDEFL